MERGREKRETDRWWEEGGGMEGEMEWKSCKVQLTVSRLETTHGVLYCKLKKKGVPSFE